MLDTIDAECYYGARERKLLLCMYMCFVTNHIDVM